MARSRTVVSVSVEPMVESGGRRSWWVMIRNDAGQEITPATFRESPDHDALDRALIEADGWAAFHGVAMTPYVEDGSVRTPSMELTSYRDEAAPAVDADENDQRMFLWRSKAMMRYVSGSVIAVGRSAAEARETLRRNFRTWWLEDRGVSKDGNSWVDPDQDETLTQATILLEADLAEEPTMIDHLYVKGTE